MIFLLTLWAVILTISFMEAEDMTKFTLHSIEVQAVPVHQVSQGLKRQLVSDLMPPILLTVLLNSVVR